MAQTEWAPTEVAAPTRTLYASFADASLAEKATGALLDYGVRNEDISLVSKEPNRLSERGYVDPAGLDNTYRMENRIDHAYDRAEPANEWIDRSTDWVDRGDDRVDHADEWDDPTFIAKTGFSTTTPQDAASGAAKGAGIGLGVGVIAALASIFIPGFGLVAGGGALATALAGTAAATAGGAIAGGVHGYLKDQGVPEESITLYNRDFHAGGAIIAVTVPSNNVDEGTVERILSKYQGNHIGVFGPDAY